MAKLKKITVLGTEKPTIDLVWDNDRHQVVAIQGDSPWLVIASLKELTALLEKELRDQNI